MRAGIDVPPSQKLPIIIVSKDDYLIENINKLSKAISTLGKCSTLTITKDIEKPKNSIASVVRETEIYISLEGTIDLTKEKEKLIKERTRIENNIAGIEKKLANEGFVAKAPAEVIAYEHEKLASMKSSLEKIKSNLESLV